MTQFKYFGRSLSYNNKRLRYFDKDASDFIERAGLNSESNINVDGLYTAKQARLEIDKLVKGMKSIGVWDKMKAVYLMLGGTSTMTALNLISNDFTITWYGGVDFLPKGVRGGGNSVQGYGDTNFNISQQLGNSSYSLAFTSLDPNGIGEVVMGSQDPPNDGSYSILLFRGAVVEAQMSNSVGNTYGQIVPGKEVGNLISSVGSDGNFISLDGINNNFAFDFGSDFTPDYNVILFNINNRGTPLASDYSTRTCGYSHISESITPQQAKQLSNLITNFNRSLNRTEKQGVLARFNFSPVGAETSQGWVNLGGDPNKGIIQATSDGVTVENTSLWSNVNGASAYTNTNTLGGIRYLDDSGVEQLLPQALTRSNWINGSNTRSIILKNVPSGNYKLRIWSYVSATGSWKSTTATVTFVAHGLTDVTAVDYKYFLNTDDRVKGVILDVQPKVDGTITVDVNWGTGAYFGAIICALELRQYF